MIADDGVTPILMDLGSCTKARITIENRSQALLQQDIAAEHSTMAYRAPELFDVKTGTTLDEKVDIWVCGLILRWFLAHVFGTRAVVGLRPVRPCVPALSLRKHANDRTRWFDSHGCAQCAVQTPYGELLPGSEGAYRQYVENQPAGTTRYSTGLLFPHGPSTSLALTSLSDTWRNGAPAPICMIVNGIRSDSYLYSIIFPGYFS
jgi:serine/threonine protein kinase